MFILGISAFYHDSAAALLQDGLIGAAAQEERFTRIKQDPAFPRNAANYCLSEAGITLEQVDHLVFYEKPLVKFDRLLETYLSFAPRGWKSFSMAMPLWLNKKIRLPKIIKNEFSWDREVLFIEHHEAHAASAFFPSPFSEAAVICFDGVGEWATTTWGTGKNNTIELKEQISFPHSIGLLYSAFTYYLGFRVNSDEYKVMGLAPYGEPEYADLILNKLIDVKEDGSFKINMDCFNYCHGLTMTNGRFEDLFGGPRRMPGSEILRRHMDLAASVQKVTEMLMLKIGIYVHGKTGADNLCMAGGVALNCVGNGILLRDGPFKKIWVQPAAGDAGGALGAALTIWHHYLQRPRTSDGLKDKQHGSYLGPAYTNQTIKAFLDKNGYPYQELSDSMFYEEIVKRLEKGEVIGWFQGRMEFGPRALGARSIIGDARNPDMLRKINLKVKQRESFRPLAPSVLLEHVSEWFDYNSESPYMLMVAPVKNNRRLPLTGEPKLPQEPDMETPRSVVPAVTHVDYSARIQTVDGIFNERYYGLLKSFYDKTGCPILVNTSFNKSGEPIVCTPEDAYRCYMDTEIDALVIGNFLLEKDPGGYVNPEGR